LPSAARNHPPCQEILYQRSLLTILSEDPQTFVILRKYRPKSLADTIKVIIKYLRINHLPYLFIKSIINAEQKAIIWPREYYKSPLKCFLPSKHRQRPSSMPSMLPSIKMCKKPSSKCTNKLSSKPGQKPSSKTSHQQPRLARKKKHPASL
jgi:hypothetical protein